MTLYRVDYSKHRWSTLNPFEATGSPIHKLEAEGVLVPVTEELLSRAEWEATMTNEYEAAEIAYSDGVTSHPLLYDDDGHVPQELEDRVREAIKRYPNMDADWWLGPVAAIRVVSDWLLAVGEETP